MVNPGNFERPGNLEPRRNLGHLEAPARPAKHTADFDTVPLVDFAGMLEGGAQAKARVAQSLRNACETVGFFYLANHGVPQPLIDAAFAECERFFALPAETKLRWHMKQSAHYCGYVPLFEENGDLHEAFDFAVEDKVLGSKILFGDYRQEANIWPDGETGFRQIVTRYSDALRLLTRQLFGAFALALDLPETYFDQMTDKPISMLRLLHYPNQGTPSGEGRIGVRAHTDHECFTILCQDGVPALQVRNGSGDWIGAPKIPGTFTVNIGDQMARWTNDRFASTVHRVINSSGRERYSIPFFVGANHDAVIEALPSCTDPDNPPKYPPIVAGDYVSELIHQGYQAPGA
jgi:isopenicillin N synthase-like dioxygenase